MTHMGFTPKEWFDKYVNDEYLHPEYNLSGWYLTKEGFVCQCHQCTINFHAEMGCGH